MDYKKFSRCIECKRMFQNKDIIHVKDFGFFCKSCFGKDKEVFGVINNFDKYLK